MNLRCARFKNGDLTWTEGVRVFAMVDLGSTNVYIGCIIVDITLNESV